jgi:predicted DCC family thiol-disulfide oxidoreductase YuxK
VKELHVIYDAQCPFCLRWRRWFGGEAAERPIEFIPLQAPELVARFPQLKSFLAARQVLAITDEGAVYQGRNALLICAAVLPHYKIWAQRLSGPDLLPVAERAFEVFSGAPNKIVRWMEKLDDRQLYDFLCSHAPPCCQHATAPCALEVVGHAEEE